MELDLKLIGRAVERETLANLDLGTWQALVTRARISRSTLNRVRLGERVSAGRYAKIERAFGWPDETITSIGLHDLHALAEIGAPADLVAFVTRELGKGNDSVKNRPAVG